MTDKIAAELIRKLDILISLAAIDVLEKRSQKEQVELLGRAGLAVKDIAALVRTTPNTVSVTLSKLKKNGKAQKAKEKE